MVKVTQVAEKMVTSELIHLIKLIMISNLRRKIKAIPMFGSYCRFLLCIVNLFLNGRDFLHLLS